MRGTDPGSAREEAERLVATALAAVRLAASGRPPGGAGAVGQIGDVILGVLNRAGGAFGPGAAQDPGAAAGADAGAGDRAGGGFGTGSPECCVCPVCRAITALRDPDPEFAERLATGAGDFAAGVASLLRTLSAPAGPSTTPDPAPATPAGSTPTSGAARASGGGPDSGDRPPSGRSGRDDEIWRATTRTGHDSSPAAEPDVWAAATRAEAQVTPGPGSRGPGSYGPAGTKPMARKAVKPPRTPGDEA